MTPLLRLYPRRWRERYAEEVTWLLEQRPTGPLDVLNLLGGALDAHIRERAGGRGQAATPAARPGWRSLPPAVLVVMGLAATMAAYALLTSVIALAAPDPDRWAGWGPAGLATGAGLTLAGIACACRSVRIPVLLGIVGGLAAAAAAPWLLPFVVLVSSAPALPGLVRGVERRHATLPDPHR